MKYNKLKIRILFISIMLAVGNKLYAQKYGNTVNKGNEFYEKKDYTKAAENYKKALSLKENNLEANFNLGTSFYKLDKQQESQKLFNQIIQSTDDNKLKSQSFHNLGNSFLKEKKYEESIQAYANSLRTNPDNENAKYNLSYALKMLKQQQQQNKNNKNDKNKKEKQDQKNQDKDKNSDKDENKDKSSEPKQEQETNPGKMSKKEAEQLLSAIANKEKEINDKMKKRRKAVNVQIEKDW